MFEFIERTIYRVFVQDDRWALWLTGVEASLTIAFFALLLGIALGLAIAVIRVVNDTSDKPYIMVRIITRVFKVYVSIIRGTPLVVQLLIMNFVILAASRNGILVASLAFGFNSGAYMSEVFRGGILSIDKGQIEAGRSLGLSYAQTMFKIILPQAFKNSLPALGNEFITLFKDTSIAGMA
ncbi:MAG: amino acid ABC transporter permease, partial [Oscillospiraceae bacterium]|nr:amino acid ABC transporter permease [Oscillospiraceae bacterium]